MCAGIDAVKAYITMGYLPVTEIFLGQYSIRECGIYKRRWTSYTAEAKRHRIGTLSASYAGVYKPFRIGSCRNNGWVTEQADHFMQSSDARQPNEFGRREPIWMGNNDVRFQELGARGQWQTDMRQFSEDSIRELIVEALSVDLGVSMSGERTLRNVCTMAGTRVGSIPAFLTMRLQAWGDDERLPRATMVRTAVMKSVMRESLLRMFSAAMRCLDKMAEPRRITQSGLPAFWMSAMVSARHCEHEQQYILKHNPALVDLRMITDPVIMGRDLMHPTNPFYTEVMGKIDKDQKTASTVRGTLLQGPDGRGSYAARRMMGRLPYLLGMLFAFLWPDYERGSGSTEGKPVLEPLPSAAWIRDQKLFDTFISPLIGNFMRTSLQKKIKSPEELMNLLGHYATRKRLETKLVIPTTSNAMEVLSHQERFRGKSLNMKVHKVFDYRWDESTHNLGVDWMDAKYSRLSF